MSELKNYRWISLQEDYLLFPFFHIEKGHLCNRITITIIIIIIIMFFGTHVPVYPGTWESVLVGYMTVHIVSTNYWGFPWIIDEKLTFARFCSYRSVTFAQGLQVIKMLSFNSMKSCKATFVRLVRSFYLWSIQLFACFLTLVQVTCRLSLCKLSTHVLPETVSLILLDLHSFLCSFMFQHFFHFSLSL